MILAVLLGVVLHNSVGAPLVAREGVAFSLRAVLRFSIILLGLQITTGQAAALGVGGLAGIAAVLPSTLAFTILISQAPGVPRGLALLIGVGTSICGASAVLAAKVATAGDDDAAALVRAAARNSAAARFAAHRGRAIDAMERLEHRRRRAAGEAVVNRLHFAARLDQFRAPEHRQMLR